MNKTVRIACLSMLLLFGVKAQNPEASQTQSPKPSTPSTSSGNNPSTSSTSLALVSDKASEKALDKASSKAASEVKIETSVKPAVAEPKVSLKNPSIKFKVKPSESKLSGRSFVDPDLEILGPASSFQATAYALYGRTRSGAYVRRGVIAADPRVIPLGSIVQIKTPGYTGVYTVHDTGKKIKGNIVDVWVPSSREARIFGRRKIKLHVLRLGPKGRSRK
ncbi:MAG: 3D domain-containing protein [Blastocatellales bacterium]